jgi:hypothetical protein
MTALRLFAVYLLAAGGGLWLAARFVRPIRLVPALFLLFAPFLFVGRAMVTAGVYAPLDIVYDAPPLQSQRAERGVGPNRPPILGDVVYQEIPWRKAVREAVRNGRLPLWNRFVLAGEPLLATQQPAVLHPATWLGFLLPLAQAWTFEMAVRFFLALLSAWLFLRELDCGELAASLGAAAWAFCDYLVFYLGYPLTPAAAPFPMLLLGLRRLASSPGRRSAALTVAALLLVVTSGHPETLLHVTASAGIFFLFDLAAAPAGRRLRAVALSAACGAVALGLTAPILLPFREAVPETAEFATRSALFASSERSLPLPESLERSVSNLLPFTAGVREPSAYAGSLLLPLALAGVGLRRRERWPLAITGLLGLAAFGRVPVINDAICRLPLFDIGLNERLVFLPAFALAALAAFGVERLCRGEGRAGALAGCAAAAAAIWALSRRWSVDEPFAEAGLGSSAALEIAPLLLLGTLLAIGTGARKALPPAAAVLLLLVQRRAEIGGLYPTVSSDAFYPRIALLEKIPRNAPYRVAALDYTFIPNIAALYELEDVRGYEAMTFAPLARTFPLWCVAQPVWFNRVDDPTKPFLSFLNVRYVLARRSRPTPPGWNVLGEEGSMRLIENPRALERAFVPRWVAREGDPSRVLQRLYATPDFAETGVLLGAPAPSAKNGEARVTVIAATAQRIELSIDARERAVIGTSVTSWPGWRLSIDGQTRELFSYNHAFLGFEIDPGRHRAELAYRPRSFVAGLWISALTLAAALVAFAGTRGQLSRASPAPRPEHVRRGSGP